MPMLLLLFAADIDVHCGILQYAFRKEIKTYYEGHTIDTLSSTLRTYFIVAVYIGQLLWIVNVLSVIFCSN